MAAKRQASRREARLYSAILRHDFVLGTFRPCSQRLIAAWLTPRSAASWLGRRLRRRIRSSRKLTNCDESCAHMAEHTTSGISLSTPHPLPGKKGGATSPALARSRVSMGSRSTIACPRSTSGCSSEGVFGDDTDDEGRDTTWHIRNGAARAALADSSIPAAGPQAGRAAAACEPSRREAHPPANPPV